jgi:hypothetical protein
MLPSPTRPRESRPLVVDPGSTQVWKASRAFNDWGISMRARTAGVVRSACHSMAMGRSYNSGGACMAKAEHGNRGCRLGKYCCPGPRPENKQLLSRGHWLRTSARQPTTSLSLVKHKRQGRPTSWLVRPGPGRVPLHRSVRMFENASGHSSSWKRLHCR